MVESKILPAIAAVFTQANVDRLPTRDLLAALNSLPDRPWNPNGQPLNDQSLARLLRPLGIRSRTIWLAGSTIKGYLRSQFPTS